MFPVFFVTYVPGCSPLRLWPCGLNRNVQTTDATVALATGKDPCCARTLPDHSSCASIHRSYSRIFRLLCDHIREVLLAPAGGELN
jgi:hypothetical protein